MAILFPSLHFARIDVESQTRESKGCGHIAQLVYDLFQTSVGTVTNI